mmetsp:Transcript_15234/g.20879  ORF Transcript_15234/g.20879 Transcript_15234/m.20879 type:complete len:267 (-) Transcript_15234:113-913(-)
MTSTMETAQKKGILQSIIQFARTESDYYEMKQVAEEDYVNKVVKESFWPQLSQYLNNTDDFELINDWPFEIREVDDEYDLTIDGRIDHALKLKSCDFCPLVIEDKSIMHDLTQQEVAKCMAAMRYKLHWMQEFLQYVPVEYCGLLHNGCIWMLIFRKMINGVRVWTYIRSPPTFHEGVVDLQACEIVSIFFQHAFTVAEKIAAHIQSPNIFKISMPVKRRGGRKRRGKKGNKTGNQMVEYEVDENCFLRLTTANVNALPIRAYKLI